MYYYLLHLDIDRLIETLQEHIDFNPEYFSMVYDRQRALIEVHYRGDVEYITLESIPTIDKLGSSIINALHFIKGRQCR